MGWWRLLALGILSLLLLGQGGPPTVSHVLAWNYAAVAPQFFVDQCVNRRQGCSLAPVAVIPGSLRTVELAGLARNRSYCWRVRLATGQVSNMVCSD
jgi:hypothetical protein